MSGMFPVASFPCICYRTEDYHCVSVSHLFGSPCLRESLYMSGLVPVSPSHPQPTCQPHATSTVTVGGVHSLSIALIQCPKLLKILFSDIFDVRHHFFGSLWGQWVGGKTLGMQCIMEGIVHITDLLGNETACKWAAPVIGTLSHMPRRCISPITSHMPCLLRLTCPTITSHLSCLTCPACCVPHTPPVASHAPCCRVSCALLSHLAHHLPHVLPVASHMPWLLHPICPAITSRIPHSSCPTCPAHRVSCIPSIMSCVPHHCVPLTLLSCLTHYLPHILPVTSCMPWLSYPTCPTVTSHIPHPSRPTYPVHCIPCTLPIVSHASHPSCPSPGPQPWFGHIWICTNTYIYISADYFLTMAEVSYICGLLVWSILSLSSQDRSVRQYNLRMAQDAPQMLSGQLSIAIGEAPLRIIYHCPFSFDSI